MSFAYIHVRIQPLSLGHFGITCKAVLQWFGLKVALSYFRYENNLLSCEFILEYMDDLTSEITKSLISKQSF